VFAVERSLSLASASVVAFLKTASLLFLDNLFDLVFIDLMQAGSYLCSAGAAGYTHWRGKLAAVC